MHLGKIGAESVLAPLCLTKRKPSNTELGNGVGVALDCSRKRLYHWASMTVRLLRTFGTLFPARLSGKVHRGELRAHLFEYGIDVSHGLQG